MARIRTIKPEFFLHDELFELEKETGLPVRLTFIGLWTQCDREGRFKWRPLRLKAAILPYDEVDMSRVLHALNTRGFLVKYANNTGEYGVIPSFKNHQVINNKESKSELPSISGCEILNPLSDAGCDAIVTREARDDDAYQGERKEGKEGKGKELNTMSDFPRTNCDAPDEQKSLPAQEESEPKNRDNSCDPVEAAFENIFWMAGLRKDAKVKARSAFQTKFKEWKKSNHGTPEDFATLLAEDIRIRARAQQLGFDKLLPATYLNGERWNDEKPVVTSNSSGASTTEGSASNSWFTPSNDGSSEVFINQAAIERLNRGGQRK
ncbi:Replication protein [Enterobacter intestinihominis]